MSGSTRLSGKLLVLSADGWVYYPCVCGHARAAHEDRTHLPDKPAPTHCSQGCGCKAFSPRQLEKLSP